MRAVCDQTDKVIANVESRKGELCGQDVKEIVSGTGKKYHILVLSPVAFSRIVDMRVCFSQVCVWQQLQAVRREISELEQQRQHISGTVKGFVVSKDLCSDSEKHRTN